MKAFRFVALLGLGLSISACANIETVTRSAPFEQLPANSVPLATDFSATDTPRPLTIAGEAAIVMPSGPGALALVPGQAPVTVNAVTIRVPHSLRVNESNSLLPRGDIVWHGDPAGDRYTQVRKIFEAAMLAGVQPMHGPIAVNLDIEVKRFHALTEKARYTFGGTHAITFDLAIRNPQTGELLVPVRTIRADLDAFGGSKAIAAEARGETQKVRITEHLARVIRQELSDPEGYRNASLGFFQLLNAI